MTSERIEAMRKRLTTALDPVELEIIDESHLHVGHAGAKDGRGHFRVRIHSKHFQGLTRLQQHRLVYNALADLMATDIHALSLECW